MVAVKIKQCVFIALGLMCLHTIGHAGSSDRQILRTGARTAQPKKELSAVDKLSTEEKKIYDELTPLYQRIYVYAFDEQTREKVTAFVNRGYNPYQMIDMVLKYDKRKAIADGRLTEEKERHRSPVEQLYESKKQRILM